MEASLGIEMDEPMAFSLQRDQVQADGSLKKPEQNFKLPGMCVIPRMCRQQFCDFDYFLKENFLNGKVSCIFIGEHFINQ